MEKIVVMGEFNFFEYCKLMSYVLFKTSIKIWLRTYLLFLVTIDIAVSLLYSGISYLEFQGITRFIGIVFISVTLYFIFKIRRTEINRWLPGGEIQFKENKVILQSKSNVLADEFDWSSVSGIVEFHDWLLVNIVEKNKKSESVISKTSFATAQLNDFRNSIINEKKCNYKEAKCLKNFYSWLLIILSVILLALDIKFIWPF